MPTPTLTARLEEARALLGVEVSASPEEVRRAYLRNVRHFKPEVDPEGFQRLRAAYELVDSAAADPLSQQVFTEEGAAEPAKSAVPAPAHSADDRAASPEYTSMPAGAIEDDPFESALAAVGRAEAGHVPVGLLLAQLSRFILELQLAGELDRAALLVKRLDAALRKAPPGAREAISGANTVWIIASEIQTLPPEFPVRVRRAIIEAVLAGNPPAAEAEFTRIAHTAPHDLGVAATRLTGTSILFDLYYDLLRRYEVHEEGQRRAYGNEMTRTLAVLAPIVLLFYFATRGCERTPWSETSAADQAYSERWFALDPLRTLVWKSCTRAKRDQPLCSAFSALVDDAQALNCNHATQAASRLRFELIDVASTGQEGYDSRAGLSAEDFQKLYQAAPQLLEISAHFCPNLRLKAGPPSPPAGSGSAAAPR